MSIVATIRSMRDVRAHLKEELNCKTEGKHSFNSNQTNTKQNTVTIQILILPPIGQGR
jgi:hypothetical protein